ncbi:uncharacterized protein LOC109428025 [Aedes albopictus]|uniref:Transcription factor n=1 Tax=Aedes albopictus TaxID=7160 RepID=A0ABM1ZUN6_AEDAL
MSAVVDPRKRSREEDVNEFMPLSKRINNLHLNNNGGVGFATEHHHPAVVGMHMPILEGHQSNFAQQCSSSSNSSGSTCHSIPSGGSSPSNGGGGGPRSVQEALIVNGETLGEYCPDLAEHENPHYFNRNKVLYELYVERMRRGQ